MPKTFEPLIRNMVDLNAPDHTRLRGLVHKAFTPRLVESKRERVDFATNLPFELMQSWFCLER